MTADVSHGLVVSETITTTSPGARLYRSTESLVYANFNSAPKIHSLIPVAPAPAVDFRGRAPYTSNCYSGPGWVGYTLVTGAIPTGTDG
ncbi:MAG: hypothetical protein WAM97_07340 [Acidimicrobiales bacterium]